MRTSRAYNLNVQQELPYGMVASLGYYGSVGRHLLIRTNENQATGPVGSAHPYTKLAANSPILPGLAIASNITEVNSIASSNYNAMWAVLTKNMSHGLYGQHELRVVEVDGYQLAWVAGWSQRLQDSNNPRGNYGLSDFDTRNHFAGTAIYALPFKGNRWVSGYQFSTIIQYQTGNPVNITVGQLGLQRRDWPGASEPGWPSEPGIRSQGAIANVTYFPAEPRLPHRTNAGGAGWMQPADSGDAGDSDLGHRLHRHRQHSA